MRKVILFIAMSLDGYIADQTGGVEWICGHEVNNDGDLGYQTLMERTDTIIMGKTTYRQITESLSPEVWPYPQQKTYVLTHHQEEEKELIHFTSTSVEQLIQELRTHEGKDIWICGGASVIHPLIAENMIDEYQICVVPTLLGKGISLFSNTKQNLYLKETQIDNGMVLLNYVPR